MERIDVQATHNYIGCKLRVGKPLPFGATIVPGGVIFPYFPVMPHLAPWCYSKKEN